MDYVCNHHNNQTNSEVICKIRKNLFNTDAHHTHSNGEDQGPVH